MLKEKIEQFKIFSETVLAFTVLPLLSIFFYELRFLFFLSPVPLLYGYLRHGRLVGSLLTLSAILGIIFLESNEGIILFFLTSVLIATVFSEMTRRNLKIDQIFIRSLLVLLFFYGISLFIFSKGHPYHFGYEKMNQSLTSLPQFLNAQEKTLLDTWKIDPLQLEQWKQKAQDISTHSDSLVTSFLRDNLIGYGVSGLLLILWASLIIINFLGIRITPFDLKKWKTPDHLVWLFVIVFFFYEISVPVLTPVSKNLFILLAVIYFLQGISIASYYFSYKKYARIQKTLGYSLLIFFPFLTACFGFFDLWANFRGHMGKQNQKPVLRPKA